MQYQQIENAPRRSRRIDKPAGNARPGFVNPGRAFPSISGKFFDLLSI